MTDSASRVPVLSIVIPAYNEAARLPSSLAALRAYLRALPASSEVIVSDDGSRDDTCAVVTCLAEEWAREAEAGTPALRLVSNPHSGKGGAIRSGVLAATGDRIVLADADFSMPVAELDHFTPEALGAFDIAIGSREAPGSHRFGEPLHRHLMGRVFNTLVRLLLIPGIQDTQCGFKCMRREVAHALCAQQTISGWGFDVELLYIARKRGYEIREIPISWYYMPGSRINPLRDTLTMLRDILIVRANGSHGLYDPPSPLTSSAADDAPAGALASAAMPTAPARASQ